MAKAATKKAGTRKTSARKAPARRAPERSDVDKAIDEGLRNASPNMQSGMDPGPPSDVREQQIRDQFANADELAAPDEESRAKLEAVRVAQQVRGY